MSARVFLSLSYIDAAFVRDVRSRLPFGLAHFYESSFENGEKLLHAMRDAVRDSSVFVLFASPEGLSSRAVQFEIEEARIKKAFEQDTRLLIFPTSPDVTYRDLPAWMQEYWIGGAGYTAADVARYITTVLLEPNVGLSPGAIKVIGRGKTLDRLEQIAADHLQRKKSAPRIYVFANFTGIGRRTFASYYMRTALSPEGSLPYGPTISLPPQADLLDLYRAVRNEIDIQIPPDKLTADLKAFTSLSEGAQASEVGRLLKHFADLSQSVTLVSTSGFFEDSGEAKAWVAPLFASLPDNLTLFIVSNRQFPNEFIESTGIAVQMRVEELGEKDIRTLMIRTAERLSVPDFDAPDEIVKAIGGHPDVANAAVRLASQRGVDVLKRQPAYLYNVQLTILGEAISDDALSATDRAILDSLCWVPALGGDLLQEIVIRITGANSEEFVDACQGLVLSCLVTAQGYTYAISPAIRQLYRRWNVTDSATLDAIGSVLAAHWDAAVQEGRFREDLFEAFVFMHAFTGEKLPDQLKDLLSPGTLESVIKETYARGKSNDDAETLERVISWGALADTMKMSPAVKEEIQNTVARAQIRTGKYGDAQKTIDRMNEEKFVSTAFLQGHFYRRKRDYPKAIRYLEEAIRHRKYGRSALHELALSYYHGGKSEKLQELLTKRGDTLMDSAIFLDLSIVIQLREGNLLDLPAKIRRLRSMPDEEGRADLREAQLMMRHGRFPDAKDFLTRLIEQSTGGSFHLRTLRTMAAIRAGDYALAKRDIDFIRSLPGREDIAQRLLVDFNLQQGWVDDAEKAQRSVEPWTTDDWRKFALILEAKAARATGLNERDALLEEAAGIHSEYGKAWEFEAHY